MRKIQSGFTLIEMLVALVIFALMSVMAYRGLTTVLESRDHLAQENRKWREVALLFARLEQDFAVLAIRPVRDTNGLRAEPFVAKPEMRGEYDAMLMFTRMGLSGYASSLAGPQRFGYRLRGDVIEQLIWPALDAAPRAIPAVNILLERVAAAEFRYLDSDEKWLLRWPLPGRNIVFPAAVEVTIELQSGERVTRLFALPILQ